MLNRKQWKLAAITLVVALAITGCGSQTGNVTGGNGNTAGSQGVVDTLDSKAPENSDGEEKPDADAGDSQETAEGQVSQEENKEPFVEDRSAAFELVSKMNVGWNLGNTFDAHGAGNSLNAEWYWGNPKTTQEMIDALAAQGFNTIRIPVTWAEHIGGAPDYTIDEEWMDRVQEVVDYAVNRDMYILLDTHHEPDFWMSPKPESEKAVIALFSSIWTQIAERFRDYDEKLLFEGMNENRVKGSANEWSGGTPQEREVINHMNQAFVDAVRATGGNNTDRFLVISTYGNNGGYQAITELEIPEDNNLIVAIHAYTPYYFTYDNNGGYDNWDGSHKSDIVTSAKLWDKELQNKRNIPVIVTEFGAVNKENEEEVLKWVEDYMNAMNKYGIKCVWWDNGNYSASGEKFAIFDRRNLTWYSQKIADKLIEMSVTGNQIYPAQE